MDIIHFTAIGILGVLLPVWVGLGLADWFLHRKSHIESTSGWRESAFHLLLTAEAASAVVPALLFRINALVILVMIVAFVAHEITTGLDVGYADPRRRISATEQRVHDYLTAIPAVILCMMIVTHMGQFLGLFGLGPEQADFAIAWKDRPLPLWYIIAFMALSSVNAFAYVEEFLRGLRVSRNF